MNKVILMGRLTKDPEISSSASNNSSCGASSEISSISIALVESSLSIFSPVNGLTSN